MAVYENGSDREQQTIAAFQLERHLRRLGAMVHLTETPEHRRECYDFEMFDVEKRWTGVVEVKSRKIYSDTYDSFIVEVERLASLRALFYQPTLDTSGGKKRWTKNVIFLFRCVNDNVCYGVNIEEIVGNWDDLEDAPPEMMKDNHGTETADKQGKLIPVELMEKFS